MDLLTGTNTHAELIKSMGISSTLQDSLSSMTGAKSHAELVKSLGISSTFQKSMDLLTGTNTHVEMIKSLGISSTFQKSLDSLAGESTYATMLKGLTKNLATSYLDPTKAVSESFKAIKSIQSEVLLYKDLGYKLVVNSDNSVTLGTTTTSYEEIKQIANELTEKTLAQQPQQFENVIATFLAEIQALKSPSQRNIIFQIFYPILIALIFCFLNPVADFYIKQELNKEDRVIKKSILKNVIKKLENITLLESYRLVTTKVLNVRYNPKAQSLLVGKFYLGHVVLLIEKRKDWSLVVWTDPESGVADKGWVFSRYLGRFN